MNLLLSLSLSVITLGISQRDRQIMVIYLVLIDVHIEFAAKIMWFVVHRCLSEIATIGSRRRCLKYDIEYISYQRPTEDRIH